jgi:hypothetical protein
MAAVAFAASLWMPDTRTKGYLDGSGEVEPEAARHPLPT